MRFGSVRFGSGAIELASVYLLQVVACNVPVVVLLQRVAVRWTTSLRC